jgi:antitoxin (DNA-binding transcriptional repressor) of toxin-antitoxin stability system
VYVVHMKRVTPTQARRHWFRLLDEVADGEVVLIERKGRRIVLRREEGRRSGTAPSPEDYRRLLTVPDLDRAETWGWEWVGSGAELAVREEPEE